MHRILTKKRALEIIANFSRAGVLVVGDVMVDHFIWGNVSRISPEAPVPVVDVQKDSISSHAPPSIAIARVFS